MRTMKLNNIDAGLDRPPRCIRKRLNKALDLLDSELLWLRPTLIIRDGTRTDDILWPTSNALICEHLPHGASNPGGDGARLAPGVGKLDGRMGPLTMNKVDDLL